MTKRFAFTLAEVLIALAIIGVVAAMTIPTFMANTAGAQFRTGFKKGITVLTQAASANYATDGYDFAGTNGYVGAPTDQNALAGSAVADGTPDDELPAIVGFDTQSSATLDTTSDLYPDTPSLFHLFQNNLNMKNSKELANYTVMPAAVGLQCSLSTSEGSSTVALSIKVLGTSTDVSTANMAGSLKERLGKTDDALKANAKPAQISGGLADLCGGRTVEQGGINQGRMFQLEDGMVFTYDGAQAYCSESNPCYGYLDVNGPAGPNRVIACSEETGTDGNAISNKNGYISSYGRNADSGMLLADCTVESKDITDIYPVLFYGSAVKPASLAAKSVLYSKKTNQSNGGK